MEEKQVYIFYGLSHYFWACTYIWGHGTHYTMAWVPEQQSVCMLCTVMIELIFKVHESSETLSQWSNVMVWRSSVILPPSCLMKTLQETACGFFLRALGGSLGKTILGTVPCTSLMLLVINVKHWIFFCSHSFHFHLFHLFVLQLSGREIESQSQKHHRCYTFDELCLFLSVPPRYCTWYIHVR